MTVLIGITVGFQTTDSYVYPVGFFRGRNFFPARKAVDERLLGEVHHSLGLISGFSGEKKTTSFFLEETSHA